MTHPILKPPDYQRIARRLCQTMRGKMSAEEMAYLGELVGMAPPGLLVDLGTYWGRSAMMLAIAGKQGPKDAWRRVLTIDNYSEGPNARESGGPRPDFWTVKRQFKCMPRVHLHMGQTDDIPLVVFEQPVALVLVDGDHTAGGITEDIEAWQGLVTEGGIMAFDDYVSERWPAVKAVVDAYMAIDGWERLGQRGSLVAFRKGGVDGD